MSKAKPKPQRGGVRPGAGRPVQFHRDGEPLTPYQLHAALGHSTTSFSPDGVVCIEECSECGMRFLHSPAFKCPLWIRPSVKMNLGEA